MFNTSLRSFAIAAALTAPLAANAASVQINSITATWSAVNPSSVVVDNSSSPITLRWGNSLQSGYDFETVSPGFAVTADTDFKLGVFTHINNAISGSSLTSADLTISFGGMIDGSAFNLSSTYTLTHDETNNTVGACPVGSVSTCDDIVTVSQNTAAHQTVTVDGKDYVFSVSGFQVGGSLMNQILTQEGENTSADLYASFTEPASVPLPAALPMLALSLGGLGLLRRRG